VDVRFTNITPVEPLVRNPDSISDGEKTVIVVGLGRGGTSVVAAVLDALGVYMGPREELSTQGAFESAVFIHGTRQDREAEIARLNELHSIWGWKWPYGADLLSDMYAGVRNLHPIFVFRDVVALMQSYAVHANESVDEVAENLWGRYCNLYEAAMGTELPALLVSFERVKMRPVDFVHSVADFLRLEITSSQVSEAASRVSFRGGYLIMPDEYTDRRKAK